MCAFLVACLVLASVIIAAQREHGRREAIRAHVRFVLNGPITSRDMPWLRG